MANYFVGDVQGCFDELQLLLAKVDFNPSKDQLWSVGDLIARGPDSLKTLRYFKQLENSAQVVLGNHELHFLALHGNIKTANPKDNLAELLSADDVNELAQWIRLQPLMRQLPTHNIIMTHAGVPPEWDVRTLQQEAEQVSNALQQDNYLTYLISNMYTQKPALWHKSAIGLPRLLFCINALTRMRYISTDGYLDFECKLPPKECTNDALMPWFEKHSSLESKYKLIFGHWAALMGNTNKPNRLALDTGCCWGEHLSMWHLEAKEIITQEKL